MHCKQAIFERQPELYFPQLRTVSFFQTSGCITQLHFAMDHTIQVRVWPPDAQGLSAFRWHSSTGLCELLHPKSTHSAPPGSVSPALSPALMSLCSTLFHNHLKTPIPPKQPRPTLSGDACQCCPLHRSRRFINTANFNNTDFFKTLIYQDLWGLFLYKSC